ncbi:MAG: D-alanine--D-alanine ligase [Planctomycetota bacterium]|nr:D-alanine--D-alanine ligase [Planctomycetota bacterium]
MKRVLVLVGEGSRPPRTLEGIPDEKVSEWKMEYDVLAALEARGYEPKTVEVSYDLSRIRDAVEEHKPHVVFNMLEDFHGHVVFDQNVVAYLELLRVPYTGCNPRGLVLSRDKALTKKICAYHRIPTPRFQVFPRGRAVRRLKKGVAFPLIVKSLLEDASVGISQASVVNDMEQLAKRVAFVHESVGDDAIAEEYIEGRELYLGVLGNLRLETFPLWELNLDDLPDGAPRIATARIKWNLKYQRKYKIRSGPAEELPEGIAARVARLSKRVFRLLGLSGYARLDWRMRPDGRIYLLEANANPDLSSDEDYALSAAAHGLSYEELIQRILNLGLRYHASWD